MNEFDDELRQLFDDERLELTARADAVQRVVRGARRRRTARMVASSVVAAGLAAVVALGSVAVAGRLEAGSSDAPLVDQPTEARHSPTGLQTAPGDDSADSEPPVLTTEGIGPIEVGMTPQELAELDGAVVEKYRDNSDWCYGEFRYGNITGIISWIQDAETGSRYEKHGVAMITVDGAVQTPEGIRVGSTLDEVTEAYPEVELGAVRSSVRLRGSYPIYVEFAGLSRDSEADDVVTAISIDVGQMCTD